LGVKAAVLMCVAYSAPASGQIAGAEFCSSVVYDNRVSATTGDPLTRMHPLVSRARYADAVRDEQWVTALRGLRDDAAQAFVKTGVPLDRQTIFFAQIDSTVDVLGRLPVRRSGTRAVRCRFGAPHPLLTHRWCGRIPSLSQSAARAHGLERRSAEGVVLERDEYRPRSLSTRETA
jgi:hypothetical protein